MKSVKMFGKKIPILAVFLATLLLVGTAATAVPANAATQTVEGETVSAYTVSMTIAFGKMPKSSDKEITGVITATYDANIGVTIPDTSSGYTTGVLDSIEYDVAGSVKCTIDAPGSDGIGSYSISPTSFSLTAGNVVDLTAYTGAVAGVWEDVVITLTITPS